MACIIEYANYINLYTFYFTLSISSRLTYQR